jgi:hypothetical protein
MDYSTHEFPKPNTVELRRKVSCKCLEAVLLSLLLCAVEPPRCDDNCPRTLQHHWFVCVV